MLARSPTRFACHFSCMPILGRLMPRSHARYLYGVDESDYGDGLARLLFSSLAIPTEAGARVCACERPLNRATAWFKHFTMVRRHLSRLLHLRPFFLTPLVARLDLSSALSLQAQMSPFGPLSRLTSLLRRAERSRPPWHQSTHRPRTETESRAPTLSCPHNPCRAANPRCSSNRQGNAARINPPTRSAVT